jgi:peptidyl-prolyl cis-trans isomerase SurA
MKKREYVSMTKSMLYVIFIIVLLMPFPVAGKVLDSVVGVVDGEVITLSDLDEAMPRYGKANILDEGNLLDKEIKLRQARKEVLDMLIEERLLQRVGQRFGVTVEDAEVDRAIEQMQQEANVNEETMLQELAAQGFTMEGYRHYLKAQIRRSRIIETTIRPTVSMAEEKIREYYQNHKNNYFFPEVRVSQILIQVPTEEATPKDWEQAKKKVETVLEGLRKGTPFEELASRYSDDTTSAPSGGDIGFFKKGEMIPMLEAVVFRMQEGDVSEVIQSSQGFHIFKATEVRAGSIAPFEEIKSQVTDDYYREEVMRLYTKWLDDLKSRSKVEVKL